MNLQVWRPENERAGRHFVYTTRYLYFFVNLLDQLNDRFNIEQIAKRVRKRASDFANHTGLWEYVCGKYIKILRRCENIPAGADENIFKTVLLDDFQPFAGEVEQFYLNNLDSPLVGVLREAAELKKLNGGLMKSSIIEDLVVDTYGVMYDTVLRKTTADAVQQEKRERMRVDHLLENDKPSEKRSTPAPEDALTSGLRGKSTKLVSRKDIIRRAETLLAFVSRPQRSMPDEHSLVPMLAISIPIRTMPSTIGPKPQLLTAEQDSATEGVNATDDEDSELSELEKSPEPPRSASSLQELLQRPERSGNFASVNSAGDETGGATPEASALAPTGAANDGTPDIEID
ncbi:Histone transcription regulator 3 [Ascosphaera aggregata]|nr:Histone transcription regulator 3 [Ascosphaera aggregata]